MPLPSYVKAQSKLSFALGAAFGPPFGSQPHQGPVSLTAVVPSGTVTVKLMSCAYEKE